MKNKVSISKDFAKNLKIYNDNKKVLVKKVIELKYHIEIFGFDLELFNKYDIKNLGNNYYRVKFIPYRVIIFVGNDYYELIELFKRKGKSDYKKYN